MRIQPEIDTAAIVFVGDFNPRIFRADWFGAQGLLAPEDAQTADTEIVHAELSKFSAEWLFSQVDRKRFIAETPDQPHIRLHDIVVRTFGEFLTHTPVCLVGINRTVHFSVPDLKARDHIGESLAPKHVWGEWGPQIQGTLKKHGGMRSLTMEQTNLNDRAHGHIRAKVEPSTRLKMGVLVEINDHYQIGEPDKVTDCEDAVAIVNDRFEDSMKRSAWIIDQVMALNTG